MTRKTKKVGGNLHCIMAFRRVEESPKTAGFFISISERTPAADQKEMEVSESEVEELDSSDSEYVLESASDMTHRSEGSGASGELTEMERRVLEAWKASRIQLGHGDGSRELIHIPVEDLVLEDVDTAEVQVPVKEEPSPNPLTKDTPVITDSSVGHNPSVSPSVSHLTVPELHMPTGSTNDGPSDYTQVGTFKKKKSFLSPDLVPTASVPDKDQSSLDSIEGRSPSLTPSITIKSRPRSKTYVKSDQSNLQTEPSTQSSEAGIVTSFDDVDGGLKRSGTFTKQSVRSMNEAPTSLSVTSLEAGEQGLKDKDEFGVSSRLRRSGTFTKQSVPSLSVPSQEASDFSYEREETGLKRTGTFTKEKPHNIVVTRAPQSEESSEDEATSITASTGEGLKRSGTFTKKKPASKDQVKNDEPSYLLSLDQGEIDLDETLKAVDMENDERGYSSGGESLEEVLVLPNDDMDMYTYDEDEQEYY